MSVTLIFGQVVGLSKKKKLYRNSPMSVCHLSTFFSPKKKRTQKTKWLCDVNLKLKLDCFLPPARLRKKK